MPHFAGKTTQGNNTYIQFRLAGKDENGNTLAEPGIHRVKYGTGYFDMETTRANDSFARELTRDPNQYINIFIGYYNWPPSRIVAYASLPWASTKHPIEGLSQTNTTNFKKGQKKNGALPEQ